MKDGLIYADATLILGSKDVIIKNALIDSGSSSTVISSEIAHQLGLKPEANDLINSVQGVWRKFGISLLKRKLILLNLTFQQLPTFIFKSEQWITA